MALSPSEPTSAAPRRGRVRLKRSAVLLVPSLAAGAVLAVLTAQGALAAQFSISGVPFTVTADKLDGQGFEQFGGLDNMTDNSPNAGSTGGQELVIVSAIRSASLTNLCQSIDLGGTNLLLTAGSGSTPVTATTLVTDSDEIMADGAFTNMNIGQDGSTLTEVPGVKSVEGNFGQQADTVVLQNLWQHNYATTAGSFKLPGLHMRFSSTGCKKP